MQKLADGHDTDVTSSPPRLWSRCVAASHAGATPDCEVAGCPPAGELAPGPGGADDPLHPVAAPMSRIDTKQTPAAVGLRWEAVWLAMFSSTRPGMRLLFCLSVLSPR